MRKLAKFVLVALMLCIGAVGCSTDGSVDLPTAPSASVVSGPVSPVTPVVEYVTYSLHPGIVSMPIGESGFAVTSKGGDFGGWLISTYKNPVTGVYSQPLTSGEVVISGVVSSTGSGAGYIEAYVIPDATSEQELITCIKLPFNCKVVLGTHYGPVRVTATDQVVGAVDITKEPSHIWYIARGTVGDLVTGSLKFSIRAPK